MIAQVKIKVFWESNNKEKSLEKHLQYDRNEDLKQYPKNLFFFDFSKTHENNKDEIFKLLNTFENLFLKPENRKIFLLKNLSQKLKQMGFK